MNKITAGQFFRYSVLPGIRPRLENLFISGFQYIPLFIAIVYQAVRLLPANHPYTNPANMGLFGVRHVVAEASNNLVLKWKNIDQIILFFTMLVGMAIALIQVFLVAVTLMFGTAMATMPTSFEDFFISGANTDEESKQDLAYILLDMVFGVPDIFDSCVADPDVICRDSDGHDFVRADDEEWILQGLEFPMPIHEGLHQMFQYYSVGLLVVASFIAFYFIITVVAETAQTGTAFGKRFNKVWAPLRIVVAFGLLIPVGFGLNSSQYIVLYAAKFGSGFATNGWFLFNDVLAAEYLEDVETLVSTPNIPEVSGLLQFMYVVSTCYELEWIKNPEPEDEIIPYFVKDAQTAPLELTYDLTYEDFITFIDGDKFAILRFGIRDEEAYSIERGHVAPICGELIFTLSDPRNPADGADDDPPHGPEPGAEIMQRFYLFVIQELWFVEFWDGSYSGYDQVFPRNTAQRYTQWDQDPNALLPPPEYKSDLQDFYSEDVEAAMLDPGATGLGPFIGDTGAIPAEIDAENWVLQPAIREKGWAGAGIWYNKIAELNGVVSGAVGSIPIPSRYPEIMEYVLQVKKLQDQNISDEDRYKPELAGEDRIIFPEPEDEPMAGALYRAFQYWYTDGQSSTVHTAATGNAFIDAVNALFGTEGLYSMRRNENVHPLAQLVGVGRSLVESSIRNLGYAGMFSAGGAISMDPFVGKAASVGVGFYVTVAMIGLTAGFVLFYIVPFLPFIYFFFAVGGWIKGIFEAMVGAPLWALAHIRIDGNGLPGQAAVNGYFLVFEIFLRPILIVFGLLASISIFAALVAVLNEIWDLVTANVAGFDVRAEIQGEVMVPGGGTEPVQSMMGVFRNAIDKFFYTVIYTIIVYLIGMSSFKLIDLIPNNILRWMGQSVATFNDQREDPAEGLVGKATVGAQQTLSQVGGGLQKSLQGVATSTSSGPPG